MERSFFYIETAVFFLASIFLLTSIYPKEQLIVPVLCAFSMGILCMVDEKGKLASGLAFVYLASLFWRGEMIAFLPLFFYLFVRNKHRMVYIVGTLSVAAVFLKNEQEVTKPDFLILLTMVSIFAVLLSVRTRTLEQKNANLRLMRDTSTENAILLHNQNQQLMEKQDYEIYLATLKERNRIAREIHDNVGHLLSRSLLQTGALLAVTDKEALPLQYAQLTALKQSLDSAMNSIRESVHGIRDDAIDLKSAVYEATRELSEKYQCTYDFDFSETLPANVKLCFLACIREGLSNIVKHSNATAISIIIREHPALYQLCISDNGKGNAQKSFDGMGLSNMRDRVESLQGVFKINTTNGFSIFISIKKQGGEK